MSERRDYVALDWVAGEIQETLMQAAQVLLAYIANRDDTTKLRFCLTHIHQVHGTLKMVEFFGAALLAEEMEILAQSLTDGGLHESHIDDALDVLKIAIAQLPLYLERVKESRHALPATLLPILNDLRAVRGESLLSETVLFTPDLSSLSAVVDTGKLQLGSTELREVVHKLRQMYQIALLGLIRGRDVRKNVNYLAKVCARLLKLTQGRPSKSLWHVCIAVLEGLLNNSIESSSAIKILLRHVDRQLKYILEYGEAVLDKAPPELLLKNLLFYIASSKENSRYIKEVKNQFSLETSLFGGCEFDQKNSAEPNKAAIQVIVEALVQELNVIKTVLSTAGTNTKELTPILSLFRRVSDTMAILGMGSTLKPIKDSHAQLENLLANPSVISSKELNEISQQISDVKADLKPIDFVEKISDRSLFNGSEEAQEQLDGAFDSVIRECRAGLEQAKEAIIEFVATQWNHNSLTDVPEVLSQVRGSLAMVPLDRAAQIVESCEKYVSQVLLAEQIVPEWQMLDTLADAITSVDYYLERYDEDSSESNDAILDLAAESVSELDYPVADETADEDAPVLAEVIPFQLPTKREVSSTEQTIEDESDDFDPEIVEIFIEEAAEVLETISEYLPQWIANNHDEEASSTVRRAFHTLKGSGRMVNAIDIGELAWSVENMLNRVIDGTFTIDHARFDIVSQASAHFPAMVTAFENRQAFDLEAIETLIFQAQALAKEQSPEIVEETSSLDRSTEQLGVVVPIADDEVSDTPETAVSVNDEVSDQTSNNFSQDNFSEESEFDPELLEIFEAETKNHLQILDKFITHCKELAGPADLSDELQRALHTLKGSANMVGISPVAALITPVEYVVKELRISQIKIDAPLVDMLAEAADFTRKGIAQIYTTPMKSLPGVELFIQRLMSFYEERVERAVSEGSQDESIIPQAQNEFLTDSLDQIIEIEKKLALWHSGKTCVDDIELIQKSINQIIDQAERVNMISLAEFAQAMQALYRCGANYNDGQMSEDFFELAEKGGDALIDMLDQIAGHQSPKYDKALFEQIQDYEFVQIAKTDSAEADIQSQSDITNGSSTEEDNLVTLLSQDSEFFDGADVVEVDFETISSSDIIGNLKSDIETGNEDKKVQSADIITEIMTDLVETVTGDKSVDIPTLVSPATVDTDDSSDEEFDSEILEIFLEEADDLLEALDETIYKWSSERESSQCLDDLLRILHTLKGGARLTRLTQLGDLSHDFETFLTDAGTDKTAVSEAFLSEVQHYQDQLIAEVSVIKTAGTNAIAEQADLAKNDTAIKIEEASKGKTTINDLVLPLNRSRVETQTKVVPFTASTSDVTPAINPSAANLADAGAKSRPKEVVKVSAQLLEDLVNLAGETSISRGQAEEQISELVFSLDEMQITVDRLQEQVRRLDMETEQQILFRQEQVESEGLDGFDPLEMDRYSALQQLSRSLLESSSDLIDIKSTLYEKSRDMETLLVQQSRINTDLQEGLMRSRMVPFSRMVPRLRRIVRQVSGELHKKVDFKLHNIDGELDRTVLERMVAPLEHMLRNAVDHGLESPEERKAAGKPSKGTISLALHREGGEIVLTLSDDGGGINLEAVRRKAIEKDLMEIDADLSDKEICQFILHSGFSTATTVTQLSGRGVGMDVVHSEVKQLGGGIDIESVPGKGTRFIVRLPFTVSVNRALMVSVDGDIYAIPLNTIEGIVRVSPFELEAYYQPDAPMFEYAGQPYLLRYMGALLRRGEKPMLDGQAMPLPVVLVRGSDHSVAIQVDHLMGSREIVVKPLGPQFSMAQGLSGATVLGDGSVVVILDLLAMLRSDASHLHKNYTQVPNMDDSEQRSLLVMVVDDSVTVRKVTSRFLERQGMEVLLAKDGVDAMTQLQEIDRLPDIMLLDIEMPRMDGFEVASRVRHTSRLKDLPIIMITSRTGEKHRERALSLGVNDYMGKPYQESELLETINNLAEMTEH